MYLCAVEKNDHAVRLIISAHGEKKKTVKLHRVMHITGNNKRQISYCVITNNF